MTKRKFIESKEYQKSFGLLSRQDKMTVLETLDFFFEQESHIAPRGHNLRENPLYLRSISVHDNLRILLRKRQDGGVYLFRVGTHDMVYKNI